MKKVLEYFVNNQISASWIFIFPAILGTFIFIIIPVFCSFGLSFTQWDLLNDVKFVGLDNYKLLFTDSIFYKILLNTIVFALSTSILVDTFCISISI